MNQRSRISSALGALALLASLSSCAQSQALSPPSGGAQVTFRIKVPQDLAADPMRVMYRSMKCPVQRSDGSGGSFEVDGYHAVEAVPQRQGQSDLYVATVARDGGGACHWQLSNVTFGVHYQNTLRFGENVLPGGGGGIIVLFDDNQPQQRSLLEDPEEVNGDLLVTKDYYSWVDEQFLIRHEKRAWLFGDGDIYLTYKAPQAKVVMFEPRLHANGVVYSVGPKLKKEGVYTQFTYPDGSKVADGSSKPSFEKLQAIRLGRDE
ncbi:hypothetical protein N7414_05455 [Pseudomonas sp. GD04087]|uniref:hypothetical protein n=1 Tax=unclassified Pseudomonas TaxID=196821 RepID=UPI00244CC215|nr:MULTISPECIES: hypothetical protein [unclassified Pseudomonas]MDH0288553.1 hypothetical protein [Pseudomonas sp. GD04087]MDH1051647.1 hypothetical protein [Pseudomonas sp. GD03903]MDH2000587.1 hypothetical protein [Pseudomonas sp. GD03691]